MRGGDTCWWDDSWNPLSGCRPTGPGCRNCYAVKQFGVIQQQHGPQRTVVPLYDGILANGHFTGRANVLPPWHDGWNWPLDWPGAESPRMGAGKPSLIFVVDMGDLFYEGHPTSRIDQVVGTIVLSAHIGLLLTRRPHRMAEYFADRSDDITLRLWQPKLWLGFSAERQREFDLAWEPIERVRVRRRERGDARPFDPTGLAERHARIARLRTQVEQRGVRALTVSSENAVATIIELLRQSERSDCATFELPPATAPRRGNGRDDVEPRVEVFGHTLFRSQDLDPVYLAAPQAVRDGQLHRWLVSYCLFYHCGAACFLSEQEDFWRALMIAAKNETPTPFGGRWPRGAERRHFRGGAAVKAVAVLQQRYGARPEDMVAFLLDGPMDIRSVIARAQSHPQFGPWIAFKVADLLDAVLGAKVKQDDLTTFLYDTPRKSVLANWEAGRLPFEATSGTVLEKAMRWLQRELADCEIPHKPGQPPDWFALETVWCKHHSHLSGRYPPYHDINEIRAGLEPWLRNSPTAQRFLAAMPAGCNSLRRDLGADGGLDPTASRQPR